MIAGTKFGGNLSFLSFGWIGETCVWYFDWLLEYSIRLLLVFESIVYTGSLIVEMYLTSMCLGSLCGVVFSLENALCTTSLNIDKKDCWFLSLAWWFDCLKIPHTGFLVILWDKFSSCQGIFDFDICAPAV